MNAIAIMPRTLTNATLQLFPAGLVVLIADTIGLVTGPGEGRWADLARVAWVNTLGHVVQLEYDAAALIANGNLPRAMAQERFVLASSANDHTGPYRTQHLVLDIHRPDQFYAMCGVPAPEWGWDIGQSEEPEYRPSCMNCLIAARAVMAVAPLMDSARWSNAAHYEALGEEDPSAARQELTLGQMARDLA